MYCLGKYYSTPGITVGHIITFKNDANWSNPKVHVWDDGASHTADFLPASSYPNKLNAYPNVSGKYYIVMNTTNFTWATEGALMGVQFTQSEGSNSTQTNCVYLFRDIDFTIPDGGGMKTNYRVYPYKSSSNSSVTMSMIPVIVAKTSNSHDPAKMYIWNSGQDSHNSASWGDQKTMTWIKNEGDYKYWYYSFESNTPTVDFNCIITNNGSDSGKTGDLTVHFASNKYAYINNGTVTNESPLPASKTVSLSTGKSASNYYELPADVYGCIVVIKLGSTYWNVQIDRDFDYGY